MERKELLLDVFSEAEEAAVQRRKGARMRRRRRWRGYVIGRKWRRRRGTEEAVRPEGRMRARSRDRPPGRCRQATAELGRATVACWLRGRGGQWPGKEGKRSATQQSTYLGSRAAFAGSCSLAGSTTRQTSASDSRAGNGTGDNPGEL